MQEKHEGRLGARLEALRAEVEALKYKFGQTETNLELEYYTLLEELQIELESAERKFEALLQAGEKSWDELEAEIEQVWRAARDLIRAVNSP
jgi:hypothetical protein